MKMMKFNWCVVMCAAATLSINDRLADGVR